MTEYEIVNWAELQHYKDRKPPWIKFYRSLLTSYRFASLPDAAKGHYCCLLLVASDTDGRFVGDPEFLERTIHATESVDLDALVGAGLIHVAGERGPVEKWASRVIDPKLRAAILERDKKCLSCGSTDSLEIDHIVPISEGGAGDPDNLQTLCLRCNRQKRQRTADYRQVPKRQPLRLPGQGATVSDAPEETETEAETDSVPTEPRNEESWNDRLAPLARELHPGKVADWLGYAKRIGPEKAESLMWGLRWLRDKNAMEWIPKGKEVGPAVFRHEHAADLARNCEAAYHRHGPNEGAEIVRGVA